MEDKDFKEFEPTGFFKNIIDGVLYGKKCTCPTPIIRGTPEYCALCQLDIK